jgi:hypothetical protein
MLWIMGTDSDGVVYEVAVGQDGGGTLTDNGGEGVAPDMYPAVYGDGVAGTEIICSDLRAADGEDVLLTPTGPTVPLSSTDPQSVVLWLMVNTTVTTIVGDLTPLAVVPDSAAVAADPGAVF